MAQTVIDALVVSLGLDASKFKQGVAQLDLDLKITIDHADTAAKKIEASGKKAASFFTKLRNEALAMFAVFVGYTGIKAFTADVVTADAATGRLAHNLAMSVEQLSEMQAAAELAGGSSAGMAATLTHMTREFQNLKLTGQSGTIPYLRLLGVTSMQELEDLPSLLDKLAGTASKMDPRRANALLSGVGIDQDTINVLIQGQEAWRRHIADAKALGVTQKADAESARLLQEGFRETRLAAMSLGRTILTELSPSLVKILHGMTDWLKANGQWLKLKIHETFERLRDRINEAWTALSKFDWAAAGTQASDFFNHIDKIVQSLGGWERATEALFALWAVGKVTTVLTNIAAMVGMLTNPVFLAALAAVAVLSLKGDTANNDEAREAEEARRKGPEEYQRWQQAHPNMFNRLLDRMRGGGDGALREGDLVQRGFLDTLSGPESGGAYNVRNGGDTFSDYSHFPEGIGRNGTSSAAGRYQFTRDTWEEFAPKAGVTDFSPASQDRVAWYLATTEYRGKTGRELNDDLRSGGHGPEISAALRGRWPTLPGGSQSRQSQNNFDDALNRNTRGALDPTLARSPRPIIGPAHASNHSAETHIGQIVINTQATDAAGIARDLGGALRRWSFVPESNYGLA